MSNIVERLEKFAEEMKDWETRKTTVLGVEIAKLPPKGGKMVLALKITPTDEEGKQLKRKALFITNLDQWEAMKNVFNDEKALELMEAIEEMRTKGEPEKTDDTEEKEEVFKL